MFYKNWPYWLKGGIIGLIIGLVIAYPAGMIIIFAMFLISPEILNYILDLTVNLAPSFDRTNGLAGVAAANFGLMVVIVIICVCVGVLIGKIKYKK